MFLIDFYKADHRSQYPRGTREVYSNFTARKSRIDGVDKVVFFGLQYVIKEYLISQFNDNFFGRDVDEVCDEYKQLMEESLGIVFDVQHVRDLHNLGYLPLEIKALSEGSVVPLQVPLMTIKNTIPEFYWLTNYFETLISCEVWKPGNSATMAHEFRKVFDAYAKLTGGNADFVDFQGHDFSFRGMSGVADACVSGAAHLLSFKGTDTVPAIKFLKHYYNATGFVGGSVPATEHSVMCADDEFETVKRLLTVTYPTGILSVVADSYDFWRFVTEFLPSIKDIIMNRNGKLVIRPDSGTPHKIICGDKNAESEPERKGLVRCLDEIFGSNRNDAGYIEVDGHVGAIYGDSIDLKEQKLILQGLVDQHYCSSNVVLGIGSYTYQFATRDTFGYVCKATNIDINGESKAIFKSPKTGSWKKSHKGLMRVDEDFSVIQNATKEQEAGGMLIPVYRNGKLLIDQDFDVIRSTLSRYRNG
jgi:nicotinamide phosphoribosyltransferase